MASHVSQCMEKAYACGTHGKPCVLHMACHVLTCMALLRAINMGVPIQFVGVARFSSWEQQEEGGREKRKGGKERRNRGKENKRKEEKEKKKNEEERRKKEEKGRSVA